MKLLFNNQEVDSTASLKLGPAIIQRNPPAALSVVSSHGLVEATERTPTL